MGKIRVKSFDEQPNAKEEKKQAKMAAEAARIKAEKERAGIKEEPVEEVTAPAEVEAAEETTEEVAKAPKKKVAEKSDSKHSSSYAKVAQKVDPSKKYSLKDALAILPELQRAKFDETVELHINTNEKGLSGNFVLPHGTGKQMRVVVLNHSADAKLVEETIKKIEGGQIEFDILIATPDTMPKLARVARVLGPRGLMPNPKNGTISPKPEEAAKKFEGGQINFKTEAKHPILHLTVGKVSFGDKKLEENIKVALDAVNMKNIKNVTLKSTMSPAIRLNV